MRDQLRGAIQIDADCIDDEYSRPVIDTEQDLIEPVAYHRIAGHFDGTSQKFTISLPTPEHWRGRFFQKVYPLADADPDPDDLGFAFASGGYVVQTNGGSGYRAEAATAKFSKNIAAEHYRYSEKIYGYIWGGSGGSYQTIAAMENTNQIWDGAVPFIIGDPSSIPNNFFAREFARIILQYNAESISDAVSPGGNNTPYGELRPVELSALAEVTQLGLPLRAWQDPSYLLGLSNTMDLMGFAPRVRKMDPSYADDFWSKPGYLGTENSPLGEQFRADLIDHQCQITQILRDSRGKPSELVLDSVPANPAQTNLDLSVGLDRSVTLSGKMDSGSNTFHIADTDLRDLPDDFAVGANVQITNRWYLALAAYARYQVPSRPGFAGYEQYRNADGTPRYPQRPLWIARAISEDVSGGGSHTGKINGKVIAISHLIDADAFPLHGHWYSQQVRAALGDRYDDQFRLWFIDNADHISPNRTDALINYQGILQQALRDVSAWAESDQPPAPSTTYALDGGQIDLDVPTSEGGGIQPGVKLTAAGHEYFEATAGQTVPLEADIEIPFATGILTSLEFSDTGHSPFFALPFPRSSGRSIHVSHATIYTQPGTYFPVLRVTVQREGDSRPGYAQVQNLGRARITVRN